VVCVSTATSRPASRRSKEDWCCLRPPVSSVRDGFWGGEGVPLGCGQLGCGQLDCDDWTVDNWARDVTWDVEWVLGGLTSGSPDEVARECVQRCQDFRGVLGADDRGDRVVDRSGEPLGSCGNVR